MKYVVLARDYKSGIIVGSFGCFSNIKNAEQKYNKLINDSHYDDYEICIEEVDPDGSFTDDECEDE